MPRFYYNHLITLLYLAALAYIPRAYATQKPVPRGAATVSATSTLELDRLSLSLIDRLPTERERDFARSVGSKGATELANQWITSKEFFERQSRYWQNQVSETPAWLWENQDELSRLFRSSKFNDSSNILWFLKTEDKIGQSACNGVWTTRSHDQRFKTCSCENSIDVSPSWDSSTSMRVCPHTKLDEYCGNNLEKCVPADARIDPTQEGIATDLSSAGGRAISRILSDFALTQGRAMAWTVVSKQKWPQLTTQPARILKSKSTIELLSRWRTIAPENQIALISEKIRLQDFVEPLRNFFHDQNTSKMKQNFPIGLTESSAEELILSGELDPRLNVYPLRSTGLFERVWKWNTKLLLSCQTLNLAPQKFSLPLPHPNLAKESSYFCSGCHLDLDKNTTKKPNEISPSQETNINTEKSKNCAIDHAINYLLGEPKRVPKNKELIQIGLKSYSANNESISLVIRDLALELMRTDRP